ncbi:MAG: phosphoenolpyruvate--protein phosphotransferase [Clostridia bacterium]|nr:phosphoenolpyruvate--protein phosphotransferase [Clostridia bacterium]
MICLHGKVVCGGIVSGTAYVFHRKTAEYEVEQKATCVPEELNRLEIAVSAVKEELTLCIEQSENDTAKDIFEIHRMMLEDEDFLNFLKDAVENGATVHKAVSQTEQHFSKLFKDTQDEYMMARVDDIRDVCGRLKAFLSEGELSVESQGAVVLVTDELLPGDLMKFGKENLTGIIISSGTVYSHTSILIKEMGVPALICGNVDEIKTGMTVLLNGDMGTAYFEPDDKTVEDFRRTEQLAGKKREKSPFHKFQGALYVNIGNARDVSDTLFNKCDGIGLFRTEYMYFGRSDLPDEEEQFSVYREILQKANGKIVTVRTFDIGSDKSVETLPLGKEENPSLGFRGLRVYSLYPEAFKIQLRALLRAAVYGNLRIMYPMVTSSGEIAEIRQILLQAAQELAQQDIPYKLPPQGAMIETPAAALLSDEIAKTVDFFSVGTNDLTQYTYAFDRHDGRLDSFCDQSYKAVISLIKTATENAHKNGIEIGICGELASLPELTEKWTQLGIDYLSISPSALA